jgi:hypothetical protein
MCQCPKFLSCQYVQTQKSTELEWFSVAWIIQEQWRRLYSYMQMHPLHWASKSTNIQRSFKNSKCREHQTLHVIFRPDGIIYRDKRSSPSDYKCRLFQLLIPFCFSLPVPTLPNVPLVLLLHQTIRLNVAMSADSANKNIARSDAPRQ